jgi:hypothetical protein
MVHPARGTSVPQREPSSFWFTSDPSLAREQMNRTTRTPEKLSWLSLAAVAVLAAACGSTNERASTDGGTDAGTDAGAVSTDGGADAGTASTDAGSTPAAIEVAGTWDDNFGDKGIVITKSMWWLDMFSPNKFNKVLWTPLASNSFYTCTVDFGLATEKDAEMSTKTADSSDPANKGCGMFSWTKMTRSVSPQ